MAPTTAERPLRIYKDRRLGTWGYHCRQNHIWPDFRVVGFTSHAHALASGLRHLKTDARRYAVHALDPGRDR